MALPFCSENDALARNGNAKGSHKNGVDKSSLPINGTHKSLPENGIDGKTSLPKNGILVPKNGTTKSLALQTSGVSVTGRYKFQRSRTFTGQNSLRFERVARF